MLSRYLQQANCQVYHSTADADLLIVNKAVESSRTMDTVLVGDDTDLFILLPRANSTKRRSWNVKSVKEKLGQFVVIFSLSMLLVVVTRPCMELAKVFH